MNSSISERGVKDMLISSFEGVKEMVRKTERRSRAGLMLGLQELGASMEGFIGGYYPVESNIIVMNRTPLRRIMETEPHLLAPYATHILLHEYIHSLGLLDEDLTRQKTYEVSEKYFGADHIVTEFARDMKRFYPSLVYPVSGFAPEGSVPIEIVKGFDRSSIAPYLG